MLYHHKTLGCNYSEFLDAVVALMFFGSSTSGVNLGLKWGLFWQRFECFYWNISGYFFLYIFSWCLEVLQPNNLVKSRHWYFMRFCYLQLVPGPPFVFGALLVICALLVAVFIPENVGVGTSLRSSSKRHPGLWIYALMVSLFSTKWIISSNVWCSNINLLMMPMLNETSV